MSRTRQSKDNERPSCIKATHTINVGVTLSEILESRPSQRNHEVQGLAAARRRRGAMRRGRQKVEAAALPTGVTDHGLTTRLCPTGRQHRTSATSKDDSVNRNIGSPQR
jgi:hypothetical protein